MKEQIKNFAKTLQIEFTGIASAAPMRELEDILEKRRRTFGISPFEERDIKKRTVPALTLPGAKSIVVCLFPYAGNCQNKRNISRYASIPDYHTIVMERLLKLCAFIKSQCSGANLAPFVDTGPLADKYLAYLAGLGFWGKNTLLINEKYGSYVFIGYIITDLALAPDRPVRSSCMGCGRCIRACPGSALSEEDGLIAERCVSYITQKKTMSEQQRQILLRQDSVYGCDICQEVCPHNQNLPKTPIAQWRQPTIESLSKELILPMSKREFKRVYHDYSFSWCGKDAVLKNFVK